MGALTDFFVASPDELTTVFPAWLPVADEPSTREVLNPFTDNNKLSPIGHPRLISGKHHHETVAHRFGSIPFAKLVEYGTAKQKR